MYPIYNYRGMVQRCEDVPLSFPPQHQMVHPGLESEMTPRPIAENPMTLGSGKLCGKTALITGGDSGIGRAVAYAFAKEGADIAIAYLYEHQDAAETKKRVEQLGRRCLLLPGDLRREAAAHQTVEDTLAYFGGLDVLVNNHGVQFERPSILDITPEQLWLTFETNVISFFYLIQAALPHLKPGSSIINTSSITAYEGDKSLIDYSASKGAIVTLTRSLSKALVGEGIRVNGVAPGPIWTPLQPSSRPAERMETFGSDTPMKRAGQPFEAAQCYVFLASDDSAYMTGQVLHPNGGATGYS